MYFSKTINREKLSIYTYIYKFSQKKGLTGPRVIRPFNFRLNSKVPNRKFFPFSPFDKILKHKTYIFTSIPSTIKRKVKLSRNVAFPTILQSVVWLSFSVFGGNLKIENWKLQSIFNFFFGQNIQNRWQNYLRRRGRGPFARQFFWPWRPLPDPLPSMRIFSNSAPLPRYTSLKGGSGKLVFTAQSLFQTWTTSVLST